MSFDLSDILVAEGTRLSQERFSDTDTAKRNVAVENRNSQFENSTVARQDWKNIVPGN